MELSISYLERTYRFVFQPKELKNKYLNDFQCLKKYCDFRKIKIEN